MSHKLLGIIFLLFGVSVIGDAAYELSIDFKNLKSLLMLALGISSCIYGYKRIKMGNDIQNKTNK